MQAENPVCVDDYLTFEANSRRNGRKRICANVVCVKNIAIMSLKMG